MICDENGFRLRAFISKPVAGAERRCLAFALEPSLALGSRLKIESNENMHKKIKKTTLVSTLQNFQPVLTKFLTKKRRRTTFYMKSSSASSTDAYFFAISLLLFIESSTIMCL